MQYSDVLEGCHRPKCTGEDKTCTSLKCGDAKDAKVCGNTSDCITSGTFVHRANWTVSHLQESGKWWDKENGISLRGINNMWVASGMQKVDCTLFFPKKSDSWGRTK